MTLAFLNVAPLTYSQVNETTARQSVQGPNIILLSQRYNVDSLVGEVMNNGIDTAEFVKISASFYDAGGNIVASEDTYADPSTIPSSAKSPFKIYILDEGIEQEAEIYEFILQWQDENGSKESRRVLTEEGGGGQTTSQQRHQNDTASRLSQGQQQNLTVSGISNQSKIQEPPEIQTLRPISEYEENITVTSDSQIVPTIPVSIVEGAALKGDKAYQPNPLIVNVGQEVKWTNDDSLIHTSTSGTVGGSESGQVFDSGILSPGASFSITFEDPGEIPYYCTLHPQMVGSITVLPSDTPDAEGSGDALDIVSAKSSSMTISVPPEVSETPQPRILDNNEIMIEADFRLHGNQYLAGRGYYLIQSFNLTTGEDNVLCPTNECSYNFEDGRIYPNTSTGGYVIDGRLKVGTESEQGVRSTIQPVRMGLDRVETLVRQDNTIVDYVNGELGIGQNIYSPDITYKIENGTVAKEDRSVDLNIVGELYATYNDDPESGGSSNGGPLEQLGRLLGVD